MLISSNARTSVTWLLLSLATLDLPLEARAGDDAVRPIDRLTPEQRELVETDLMWAPRDVSDDEDAAPLVIEACAKFHPIGDELVLRLGEALDGDTAWLQADDLTGCREAVLRNAQALDLIAQAAAQPAISVQEHAGLNASSLRVLFRLGSFRAHELASHGHWEAAIDQLCDFLRVGRLLQQNPAETACYFTGIYLESAPAAALTEIAVRYRAPREQLVEMRRQLESPMRTPVEAESYLRHRFQSHVLPVLVDLPDDDDLCRAVQVMVNLSRPGQPIAFGGDADVEFDARTAGLMSLLEGHPEPFNKEATLRLMVECYQAAIRHVEAPREYADSETRRELHGVESTWPIELSLHPIEMAALLLGHSQPEVTAGDLKQYRRELENIRNPLGRHFVSSLLPDAYLRIHADHVIRMTVSSTTLALYSYASEHGRMPEELEDLVGAEILDELPSDPYGDVLRYSADRRLLWSLGPNGIDDGGHNNVSGRRDRGMLRKIRPPGADEIPDESETPEDFLDDLVFMIKTTDAGPRPQ